MTVTSITRTERLRRLTMVLPRAGVNPVECPDTNRLLSILSDVYGRNNADARASQRTIQRDLQTLVEEGRIEAVNPGSKPLRFRRLADDPLDDGLIREYTLQQVRDLIAEAVSARRLDRLWERLLHELDGPLLDAQRLRIIPDTLRLGPVELYPDVLQAVIQSLIERCALQVLYQNAEGIRAEVIIHPHALVQRGPIPYLFALKNDEVEPVRLYALHRIVRAQAQPAVPVRVAAGFDLDRVIAAGVVDFGQGTLVDLELRVRGYLSTLLEVCPLSDDQFMVDEPADAAFSLRVKARVPSTGQLLRWLLGAGDNLEVVGPAELRHVVAAQSAKVAALYAEP
jgi:predicted DNA-binding transcriptional regulator YafY